MNAKKGFQFIRGWNIGIKLYQFPYNIVVLSSNRSTQIAQKKTRSQKVLDPKLRGSTCLTGQQGRSRGGACLGLGRVSGHTGSYRKE